MVNNKNIKISAYDSFQCTGSLCKLSCCKSSWIIEVDESITLDKWKNMADVEQRDKLVNSVYFDEKKEAWLLNKDENSQCVHLEKDLCFIHGELGEDYLPDTCKMYPRIDYSTSQVNVLSLQVSCPEATRLIFEGGEKIKNEGAANEQSTIKLPGVPEEIYAPIEKVINETLAATDYSLNIRMYHIGKCLCDIATLSQAGKLSDEKLEIICGYNRKGLRNTELAFKYEQLTIDDEEMGRFWSFIYKFIPNIDELIELDENPKINRIKEIFSGTAQSADEFVEVNDLLTSIATEFNEILPENFEQGMTNILKVKFINNHFPWAPIQGNFIAPFIYSIFVFALMRLLI
ncbi:MAG: flagellin lysine-N-methylase, partial [Thiohalomonadales bacterium]